MGKYGDDSFDEEEKDFDYNNDDYADEMSDSVAEIPAELMNRWKQAEIDLDQSKLNLTVLQEAVKLSEKSLFWRFRSLGSRIRMVCDTYYAMSDVVNPRD